MRKYFFVLVFLSMPAYAHAAGFQYTAMDGYIDSVQADAQRVATMTGIEWKDTYPHATCYYDDLEDHYAQEQLMSDAISEGIR